ncbi:DNA polymerase [Chloroflexota bacterium]
MTYIQHAREIHMTNTINKPGPLCARCPLRSATLVPPMGGKPGGTLLVIDAPGETDAAADGLFSGRLGDLLRVVLPNAGVDFDSCARASLVRCHVERTRKPPSKAIECCSGLFWDWLKQQNPATIITLGEFALDFFRPGGRLRTYHGIPIPMDGYIFVPMYRPDSIDDHPDLVTLIDDGFLNLRDRKPLADLSGRYSLTTAKDFSARVPRIEYCALDIETEGLERTAPLVGLSVCSTPGRSSYFHREEAIKFIKSVQIGSAVLHNAKFDLVSLAGTGIPVGAIPDIDDSMILAYCMNKPNLGLKDLAVQELGLEMRRFEDVAGNDLTLRDTPAGEVARYCGSDTDGTLRLWRHLSSAASPRELSLYHKVEKPLIPILAQMALNGVHVNVGYLEKLQVTMSHDLAELERRMQSRWGIDGVVLRSTAKLGYMLYHEFGLKVPRFTETGSASTSRDALEALRGKHEAIDLILDYRSLSKLKVAFVDNLLGFQTGCLVYPEFSQTGTVTGRMSSSGPNMQQLPKREDKTIRRAFAAPEGYLVASFDNSQIDLRVLAYESQDPEMLRIFNEDADIHDQTAGAVFGEVNEGTRRLAKTLNFATVFGAGYKMIAEKAGISEEEAKKFLDRYFQKYAGVPLWIRKLHGFVEKNGFSETLYGRRRYLPKVYTPLRWQALKQAQNAPIQGGSSDVIKLQMAAVADVATPFAQVHDELDFYLPEKNLDEIGAEIKRRMEGIDCPFKLKVEVKVGPNLGDLEDWNGKASTTKKKTAPSRKKKS